MEDDVLLSSLLLDWIRQHENWIVAGHACDGNAGFAMAMELRPDVILLDLAMPNADGFSVSRRLKQIDPRCRIILLTCHSDPCTIQRVNELDVDGYVNKTSSLDILDAAIDAVIKGGKYYDATFVRSAGSLNQPLAFHKILSDREIEVLALVTEGRPDDAISHHLGISVNTVATHRRNIRQKLDAHSDRDLVFYAHQWGIGKIKPVAPAASTETVREPSSTATQ